MGDISKPETGETVNQGYSLSSNVPGHSVFGHSYTGYTLAIAIHSKKQ